MESEHTVTTKDKWFLDKHMKDPIAQEPFKVGDTIVICAKCKTAQYDVSWNMNSNKCCSLGCDHDHKLQFRTFSPEIFRPDMKHNRGFRIVEEKMLFRNLLKIIGAFPMGATVIALLPLLAASFLFRSALHPAVSTIDGNEKLTAIHEKFIEIGENSYDKSIYSIEKILSLDVDLGKLEYRTDMPEPSFGDMATKIETIDLSGKLRKLSLNIYSIFKLLKAAIS